MKQDDAPGTLHELAIRCREIGLLAATDEEAAEAIGRLIDEYDFGSDQA